MNNQQVRNILIVDLDGTIRETISGDKFINTPQDQQLIKGVEQTISQYKNDWLIVGATNQGGVAAGKKSLEDVILEQKITLGLVKELSHIYLCPTFDGLECWKVERDKVLKIQQYDQSEFGSFRKPGGGMLKLALQGDYFNRKIMVGDRQEDCAAAAEAGVEFIWASDWLGINKHINNRPEISDIVPT